MFERSEFARRTLFVEKRKAPMQSIGKRPGRMVLGTFAETKVPRQQAKNMLRHEGLIKPDNQLNFLYKMNHKANLKICVPTPERGNEWLF